MIEEGLLWDITHCGVSVMFMKDVFMEIGDGGDICVLSRISSVFDAPRMTLTGSRRSRCAARRRLLR